MLSTVLGKYSMNYMGIMSEMGTLLSQGKCRGEGTAMGDGPRTIYLVRGQMPQGTGQVPPVTLQEPEAGEYHRPAILPGSVHVHPVGVPLWGCPGRPKGPP